MSTQVETDCKFCGKHIVMHLTHDWNALGRTITNLLPMVCCNPCGRAREELRQTTQDIKLCCHKWSRLSVSMRDKAISIVRQRLGRLVMDHLSALAKIRNTVCPDHDSAIVDQLMERPERWFETLKQAHDLVRRETQTTGAQGFYRSSPS